jgi:uncharacterized protein YggU (UPF0235/DUF167 family)
MLQTKKYNLTLIAGHKSREKVVRVEGLTVEQATVRLEELADTG